MSLSMMDIEGTILALVQIRESAETPEEVTAADEAIAEWTRREVQKVDGVRGYRRWLDSVIEDARAERDRQAERARLATEAKAQLDGRIIEVMQAAGKTRIDGKTGPLKIQGNGGLQPLTVNMLVLPREYQHVTVRMSADMWDAIVAELQPSRFTILETSENGERIRADLINVDVAGARLEDRAVHVRTK